MLTNALKYAPDRAVTLQLVRLPDMLRIRTSNWADGAGQQGSALGLLGMRERLDLLGGELTHCVTPEGRFDLVASVPLRRTS